MSIPGHPIRLFLDAGVVIEGLVGRWGSCKSVLALATIRVNYTIVLAEAIESEIQRNIARKITLLDPAEGAALSTDFAGWLRRIRIERHPYPAREILEQHKPQLLPVIRHGNDLPAVVTAILARPDWVLSTNTAHWNPDLADRTGLRIATPLAFLTALVPAEQP